MHRKGIAQRYRFQAQTGRQVRPETAGFRNMSDAMCTIRPFQIGLAIIYLMFLLAFELKTIGNTWFSMFLLAFELKPIGTTRFPRFF